MARAKGKLELTLFPFISVLAGLIAVMMLFMMITLGTRVIADEDDKRAPVAAAKPKGDFLDESEPGDTDGIDPARYEKLKEELLKLSSVLEKRIAEHKELVGLVDELEGLIQVKKTELEIVGVTESKPGRKLGEPTMVNTVPDTGGRKTVKKPVRIEVSASGYTVRSSKAHYPAVEKKAGAEGRVDIQGLKDSLVIDPGLSKFLADANAKRSKEYLVFWIHPNGANAFQNIKLYIILHYKLNPAIDQLDIGWEPFSRDWLLLDEK